MPQHFFFSSFFKYFYIVVRRFLSFFFFFLCFVCSTTFITFHPYHIIYHSARSEFLFAAYQLDIIGQADIAQHRETGDTSPFSFSNKSVVLESAFVIFSSMNTAIFSLFYLHPIIISHIVIFHIEIITSITGNC